MLARIAAIALNAYREAVRARILLGLGALALATALYSIAIGEFALKNAPRVVADLGATSVSLYGIVVAVVMGATSLYRELEQKTIFPILARPISRAEYLVGKYAGALLTLAVFMAFDAGTVLFILAYHGGRSALLLVALAAVVVLVLGLGMWRLPRWRTFLPIPAAAAFFALALWLSAGAIDDRRVVVGASALAFFEVMIVSAVATLFSSFSSPFLTAVFTFGVFLVGREADTLGRLPARVFGETIKRFGAGLARVVPNLQHFVPPRPLLTGETPGVSLLLYVGTAGIEALAWSVALLAVASIVFRERDFL